MTGPLIKNVARNQEIRRLVRLGATARGLASMFGMTHQGIHLIAHKEFAEVKKIKKSETAKKKKESHRRFIFNKYGLTLSEYSLFAEKYGVFSVNTKGHPYRSYALQKKNSYTREIGWEFNFKQWWDVWQKSGKWEERGLGAEKYVMARHCDVGPYSKKNVYICTGKQNMYDHYEFAPHALAKRGGLRKITEIQFKEIVDLLEDGARPVDIAFFYGIHASTVSNIKNGKHGYEKRKATL